MQCGTGLSFQQRFLFQCVSIGVPDNMIHKWVNFDAVIILVFINDIVLIYCCGNIGRCCYWLGCCYDCGHIIDKRGLGAYGIHLYCGFIASVYIKGFCSVHKQCG